MEEKYKNSKMFYNYKKRTKGGFADALFLVAVIATGGLWFMIFLMGR